MTVLVRALAVAVLAGGLLAGCSSAAPGPAAPSSSPITTASLGPLTRVHATEIAMGRPGRLPGSVAISVSDPVVHRDSLGAWITVQATIANSQARAVAIPDIGLFCVNNAEPGNLQADSTIGAGQSVPAGATIRGTLNLLAPGDRRYAATAPVCGTPAYVQWTAPHADGVIPPAFRVRVPDAVVAQLNDQRFVLPS